MKNSLRIPTIVFSALLLLIAAFPPGGNGWIFFASPHFHRTDWSLIALECIGAAAIGLLVWAIRSKE